MKIVYLARLVLVSLMVFLLTTEQAPAALQAGTTTRVSVASDGTQGNKNSNSPAISADGRYVTFSSYADNLVSGDTNNFCGTDYDRVLQTNCTDIFIHGLQTGLTELVSLASNGEQGNDGSYTPSISADGRYVAFESGASNLVSGDTNVSRDVFVHDRQTGETERVSVASDGTQGDGSSHNASINADGRYVAFESWASNLVSIDTNVSWDVFVHDRQTGETERVSVASDGTQGNDYSYTPSISADGRYVAFNSNADNLVSGDTNSVYDVFVHDRQTGETERVSVASDGTQGNGDSNNPSVFPSISADGRYVAFVSNANNLVSGDTNVSRDVFVHDRQTGETERVSVASDGTQGNGHSYTPSISADGRYVAFDSWSNNLVSGDTNSGDDVFLHDRQTGETERVSVASDGAQGDDWSYSSYASISVDGRFVAFESIASNLVGGDTNAVFDVFVHERPLDIPTPTFTNPPPSTPTKTWTPIHTITPSPTQTKTRTPTLTPSPGRNEVFLPIEVKNYVYYFKGPWEIEDNDSYLQANGPLRAGQDYFGYPDDQKDYFSVYLNTPGTISIDLSNHTGQGVQLLLYYQSDSNMVARDFTQPYHIDYSGVPGWYYVYIYTEAGFNNITSYTLRVSYP